MSLKDTGTPTVHVPGIAMTATLAGKNVADAIKTRSA
jgi:hypothetical protein